MKFEYIILLIIAFNVIAAVVKKRKADKASLPAPAPTSRARTEAERVRDLRAQDHSGNTREHRAETRGEVRDAREGQDLEALEPAPRKGGMGRDLLEQLAKEIGLETAPPERPRPEASPYKAEQRPESTAARRAAPEVVAVVPPATHRVPRRVTAPVTPIAPAAPLRSTPGLDLRDREALRGAIIAREILGPPVSRGRAAR